jgi:hypothetical protein
MRKAKTVRILISLPLPLKEYLEDLRRLEHVTVSGYIQQQLRADRQARMENGWRPSMGWAYRDTPAWRKLEGANQKTLKKAKGR